MADDYKDPFAEAETFPSISFKDKPIGHSVTGTIVELPSKVQSRDYDTGELLKFDNGDPKWSIVTTLDVNGEKLNLWCAIIRKAEQSLFNALADAQKAAGARFEEGGTLTVKFVGEKQGPNKKREPRKLYAAKYVPPKAEDPFEASPAVDNDEPPF